MSAAGAFDAGALDARTAVAGAMAAGALAAGCSSILAASLVGPASAGVAFDWLSADSTGGVVFDSAGVGSGSPSLDAASIDGLAAGDSSAAAAVGNCGTIGPEVDGNRAVSTRFRAAAPLVPLQSHSAS